MKNRPAVLILVAAAALLQTATIQAQNLNPPYLREMPLVERVKAEITGKDAMETAARQMGAFWQLLQVIQELAGQRFYRNQLTPDESRLMGQYRLGYSTAAQPYAPIQNSPTHPDKPKWFQMHSFYETDPGFLDGLLKKFVSPEFRAQFYKTTGKEPPAQPTTNTQPSTPAGTGNAPSPSDANKTNPSPSAVVPANAAQELAALQAKAERGDAAAQYKLAEDYFSKIKVVDGLKWLRQSAEGGYADAQNALGFRYLVGNGGIGDDVFVQDVEEGRKWLKKAAQQGHSVAQAHLCNSYVEEMDLFKGAVPLGDFPPPPVAGSKQDVTEACNWCEKAANQGNADSGYKLGLLYARDSTDARSGDVKPDYEKAYFWLTMRNAPKAKAFREKVGQQLTPEKRAEVEKKVEAFRSAAKELAALQAKAEQGDTAAQKQLGEYYFGEGDKQNGLKWLQKSAEGGNVKAQNSLGWRYEHGRGVPENVAEARKWYRMASEQGDGTAQANLCSCYVKSLNISDDKDDDPNQPLGTIKGTKADMEEAIKWCGVSAKRGSFVSQNRLGWLYAKGSTDVKPNYEEAYFWLSVTKASDALRDKIGKKLAPAKRAEIEQRAKDWKPMTTPPRAP